MSNESVRTALVTGSGMGIGQGIALELARRGFAVAVQYAHSETGARETVSQIERAGGRAIAIGGDLRGVATCRSVVDQAAAGLGGLDVLVNNSGVTRAVDFLQTTEELFNEQFEINIRSYFFCAQQAVPHMLERGGGAILNISSIHGAAGYPQHVAYAATKGAVVAFTRTLAIELAPLHIRVNAVAPGLIEVPRYFEIPGYTTEFGDTLVPWGRIGSPDDISKAAAFLVSEDGDFITGQTLYVDGGTSARMGLFWEVTTDQDPARTS
jgi:NAD(P)-dependent dehydrogenase (short-subunit alcohol dehydrogenase family)